MATAAQQLADFGLSLRFEQIPSQVVRRAKLHVLDVLGCGLAAHAGGVAAEGRAVMADMGGDGQATVIGLDRRLPAANAAFANAMLCHGLDFDDTHAASVAHLSVVILPAALAAGQRHGAGGRELVRAVVAGHEIAARVGKAAAGSFHRRGFHPTPICGIFGAVASASMLSQVTSQTTVQALGIAGSMASGIFEYLADGSATKRLHPGWAAHGALIAVALASRGATGPASVLEGDQGLYATHLGDCETGLDSEIASLADRWEISETAFKQFPACHYLHGALGALVEITEREALACEQVETIVASVPDGAVSIVCEPLEHKRRPRSDYEAKFSLPYALAAQLVHGRSDLAIYSDTALQDERVLELAQRITYREKPYGTYPGSFPGGVEVATVDGRVLTSELDHQPGSPQNPMSGAEIVQKFHDNASLALDPTDAKAVETTIGDLEQQRDLDLLGHYLARAESRAVAAM